MLRSYKGLCIFAYEMIIDVIYIKNPCWQKYFLFENVARVFSRCIITLWGFRIDMMMHCRAKELLKTYVYFIPFIFKICMQEDTYSFTGEYAKEQRRAEGNPKLGTREVVIPLYAIPEDCGNPPK